MFSKGSVMTTAGGAFLLFIDSFLHNLTKSPLNSQFLSSLIFKSQNRFSQSISKAKLKEFLKPKNKGF